jgi:hypothetical protein
MNPQILRGRCPVCGKGPLIMLPTGYKAFVEKDNEKKRIGGLVAFQCEEEGHVFFVMAKDVEGLAA